RAFFALFGIGRGRLRGGFVCRFLGGCSRCSFFAFFEVAEVVTNGNADALQCFFADARDFFELFRCHVGQRFDGRDTGSDKFLNDAFAEFSDLLDGRGRAARESLHLLLDFLALLFLALDVDLPSEKLRCKPNVLALFADGERQLRIVDDDFELLVSQVGDGDTADLRRLQSLFGKGGDLLAEFNDVDLFATQFADDRLDTHALHADAGANRIHILIAALHGDLGALAGFARDGANHHGVVVDLRNFRLEQVRHQLRRGARDNHLRSLCGAVDLEQHHPHALTDRELFKARLFALGASCFRLAEIVDYVLAFNALHGRVENFLFAMRIFLEDGVTLGFTHLLEDDLFG